MSGIFHWRLWGKIGQACLLIGCFLEDWELERVAVSCHLAVDLLCQEMQDARKLFDLLSALLPTVAAVCRFLPSRMGCNSMAEGCDGRLVQVT